MSASWGAWWAAQNLPVIEWVACGLSFGYVYLAGRNSVWCWPLAFVGSCLWAFQVWTAYDLYFDTALNIFYAAMAVLGLSRWYLGAGGAEVMISRMKLREHAAVVGGGVVASVALTVLAQAFTTAALPAADATTTVFSVLATFLLIGRRLENWIYFIVIDVAYVWIYLERGSVVFALTFAIYTAMAAWGYRQWRGGLDVAAEAA